MSLRDIYRASRRLEQWMLWVMGAILTLGVTAVLSLSFLRGNQVDVQLGAPSAQRVTSNKDQAYTSSWLTEQARDAAASRVTDVYTPIDRDIGRNQIALLRSVFGFITTVREDRLASREWKQAALLGISVVQIEPAVVDLLIDLSPDGLVQVEEEAVAIIDELMRREIRDNRPQEIAEAVQSAIRFGVSGKQETILTALVPQLIVPNTFYDQVATEQARLQARANVPSVERTILNGETILREGQIVTPLEMEMLMALRLLQEQPDWWGVLRNALVAFTAVLLLMLYYVSYREREYDRIRYMLFLSVFLLLQLLAAEWLIQPQSRVAYLLPAATLSILTAMIFDGRLALVVTLLTAALSGYIASNSLEMAFYGAVGGLLAILTMRDVQRINALFRAGVMAAVGNWLVLIIFQARSGVDLAELARLAGLAFAGGILSAALAILGLFAASSLFGIITLVQLQELSRFDQPLLKQLLHTAPGTYHHSIMVANLAEQAAERIGANSLLARVGAFYHDIGKMSNTLYFTENQEGENPHDELDPYVSAELIIAHVVEGQKMARRARLPERIQDFIMEHHGNYVVKYFYRKALDAAQSADGQAPAPVDEARFRYPGPPPRSRETGIVMLADAVEATSKAVQPNTVRAIEKLVYSITDELLDAHQLDDSGLSLGDLRQIRESFIETLQGRFHVRVRYAGNEALEAENARPLPPPGVPVPPALPAALPAGEKIDVAPTLTGARLRSVAVSPKRPNPTP